MICSGPLAPPLISAAQLDVDDADGGEGVRFVALGPTRGGSPERGPRVEQAAGAGTALAAERPDCRGRAKTEMSGEVELSSSQGSTSWLLRGLGHIRGSQNPRERPSFRLCRLPVMFEEDGVIHRKTRV